MDMFLGCPASKEQARIFSDCSTYSYTVIAKSRSSLLVACLLACLTSQQHAGVSQRRICWDNCTCRHAETEAAGQTFYLTHLQYTDTGPTSPNADLMTPDVWQGSHWSANSLQCTGMTQPGKIPTAQVGIEPRVCRSRSGRLKHWANEAVQIKHSISPGHGIMAPANQF